MLLGWRKSKKAERLSAAECAMGSMGEMEWIVHWTRCCTCCWEELVDCEAAPGMSIGVTRECVGTFQTVAEQKIEEGSKQGGMAANSSISRVWLEPTKARTLACSSIASYERMFLGFDVLVVLLGLCKRVCSAANLLGKHHS